MGDELSGNAPVSSGLEHHPGPSVRDPVCGMAVDPATAAAFTYNGQAFFFCRPQCLEKFKSSPARYLGGPSLARLAGSRAVGGPAPTHPYTCPMHPEVQSDTRGSC